MNQQELLDLFAESIEVEPGTLTSETRIADVPEWNSLGWLTIMSALDDRGVQLGSDEIRKFQTAGDVIAYVTRQSLAAG